MKRAYIVGGVLVLAFATLGLAQLKSTLRTYVGFPEARASGEHVQIKGKIDKESVHYDKRSKNLVFEVTSDEGESMQIVYRGSVPGNFNQASHVVAMGQYADGTFHADQLLIKCPSKYQGQSYPGD